MIRKLRKKLMLMFLSFTMLTFTAAMFLMISNTVDKVHNSEIEYMNNISDGIIDLVKQAKSVSDLDLTYYDRELWGWVYISDGEYQKSSTEIFDISADMIIKQIESGKNIISMQEISPSMYNDESSTRIIHLISGENRKTYYAMHSTVYTNNIQFDLIFVYPRSSFATILRKYCSWYLFIWLGVCILMYFMSHVLIGKAVQPVEAAMKSQKEFIASASHELKSPLAVIQANAETLDIEKTDTVSEQKQKVILSECNRMSNLIKSMLSLAASDTGRWVMDMQETDIDTLLIETWEMFVESARKKNLRLDLNIEEHYPKLKCDKEHIQQTLAILLDNAISYSPLGLSIEMGATVKTKHIIFYVIDHGPGIADTDKGKVFQRFYSVDHSRSNKDHYGLGLSIALEIVKLHHGTITLKDTLGGGCTFEIQIPFEKASY